MSTLYSARTILLVTVSFVLTGLAWPARAQSLLDGQYKESRYDLSPLQPSPKVAKLGVYGDIPVDNYTGVPDIKIPLYTYHYNGLEVPVYLSYHSTGLLVDEQASEVGLGWSLHAGGVIGHTIYGTNDEYNGGFGRNGEKIPIPAHSTPSDLNTFYMYSAHGQFDTEPDMYNFSYGDQSGRYVLDYKGQPHTTPFKDVRIEGAGGDNPAITDEQGVRYVYANRNELTTTLYGSYCIMPPPGTLSVDSRRTFVSARYLTQLISPTRDTIQLGYTPEVTTTRSPADYTMTRVLSAAHCKENITNHNNEPGSRLCQNDLRHAGYQISSITSRSGVTVRFYYDPANRLDCLGGHRLQAIEVTDGNRVQHWDFYQSYFQASNPLGGDSLTQAGNLRLRLDSVRERGTPAYKFRYRLDPFLGFPALGSFAQDVMGYYNGTYNSALVSKDMFTAKSPLIEPAVVNGVDRRLDTLAVRQGMLERITYPTGGYSSFLYEPHDYLVDKHFIADSSKQLAVLESSVNDEIYAGNQHDVRQSFRFAKPSYVRLQCKLLLFGPFAVKEGVTSAYYVTLQDSASGNVLYAMPPGPSNDSTVAVPAGTFIVTVSTSDTGQKEVLLNVGVSEIKHYDQYVLNYPFYGCRIKTITSSGRTPYGQDQQKSYRYRAAADLSKSSGYVLYRPELLYTKEHFEEFTFVLPDKELYYIYQCDYSVLSQSPVNPLGTIHGGNLAYGEVQVLQQASQATTRTDYVYSTTPDYDGGPAESDADRQVLNYPFPPPTSFDWQRGQLLKQTIYAKQDAQYVPIKITRNRYNSFFTRGLIDYTDAAGSTAYNPPAAYHHLTIIPACRAYVVEEPNPTNLYGTYRGFTYYYVSAFDYLRQVDETTYGPAGDSVLTRKTYAYDSPLHTQPTRISSTGVSGDTLTTHLTYPEDYALGTSALAIPQLMGVQGLQQAHMKTPVIESYTTIQHPDGSTRTTQAQLTEYNLVQQVPLVRKLWEWQTLGTFSPLVTTPASWTMDGHYLLKSTIAYRPDYSVLAIKRFADQSLVVLRSTDKQVIAQVQDALPAQVAFTSFEPGASGNWRYDSTGTHRVAGGRTGRWAYRLDGQQGISKPGLPAGDYELTYWQQGTVPVRLTLTNGSAHAAVSLATAPGDWHQYRARLQCTAASTLTLDGGNLLLDEVRLLPIAARMTSYTNEPLVGATSQTDATGRTLTYEYDELGRLVRTRDEQGRILSQQQYHYAQH